MTTEIHSPEKISRAIVLGFIESLGIDPHHVKRLTFLPRTLFVDVAELNENGNEFVDPKNPNEIALKTISIPIEF